MGDRRAEQGAVLAGGTARVGGGGLGQRLVGGDGDEAVELRVELGDARQQGRAQLDGGEVLGGQAAGDLRQSQLMHHSITLGTRYRPFSTAGAMAW
ncbi:hypothetical protein D3C78_1101690 [compost metagenome]